MPPENAAESARIDALVEAAMPRIVAITGDMDFATFQTAARVPKDMAGAGEVTRESFRMEARLALLRRLETLWPDRRLLGVGHDVKVTLLPDSGKAAAVFVEPLLVAGRYRKLARGVSQTVFHCRACRGRRADCEACGGSRRAVAEAVEDFIRPPIVSSVGATRSSFHGSGREDIDVLMLGTGRPFVVSVQWPHRRTIDAESVAREVEVLSGGRVTVSDLEVVDRAAMRRITMEHGVKSYRATVRPLVQGSLPSDTRARLASLVGVDIRQRTPERVEGRRADLVRVRRVLAIEVEDASADCATVHIRTEPGTYVKELISGDGGRTVPSFASVLAQACACSMLDVVFVG